MNGILETFLLSMAPIGELRAAIPVALTVYKLNWPLALAIAVLGNLAPVVFLLLFLAPISKLLSQKSKTFQRFFNWLFQKTRRRVGERAQEHGWLYLIPFVALPLPITGAWTGCLIAFLFKIPFRRALPAIALGVIIAGIIVTTAAQAGIAVERYFGWPTLLIAVAISVAAGFILKFKIRHLKFNKNLKFKI